MTQPTAQDQYMLELVNRGRLDPQGEADLYLSGDLNEGLSAGTISTDAKQPLAFNLDLNTAAEAHSQWLLDNNKFQHSGEGGTNSRQRMEAAGYTFTNPSGNGENLAWLGTTGTPNFTTFVRKNYENLFIDAGIAGRGHRVSLMNGSFQEVGISSILQGGFLGSYNAVMSTQDFAYSAANGPFITGVAYTDAVSDDDFYTVNEGIGGITVTAVDIANSANTFTTTTWDAGGYSLDVAANATYDVTFSGDLDQDGQADDTATYQVTVGSENVKQDVVSDNLPAPPPSVPTPGDDNLNVDGTTSVVQGLAGNDTLTGSSSGDSIGGGEGNDVLNGEVGNDSLTGWTGNDQLNGGSGNDTLQGGDGLDTLNGGDNADTLKGGNDADELNGDGGNDSLEGQAGNDILNGDGGNDSLEGQAGNDILNGGDGDDTAGGGIGDDIIDGGTGNDSLTGWKGNDNITGGTGNDMVKGGDGLDTLNGGDNADTLKGGNDADELNGDGGNDFLEGQAGNDLINGGDGDDTAGGGAGDDIIDGGTGNDSLTGWNGNDNITGGTGNDIIQGGDGLDTLTGVDPTAAQPGNNEIDTLRGGAGADLFILGDGQVYYDDNGTADYALIGTFNSAESDRIQLYGNISDYDLQQNVSGLPAGTAIYSNSGSELIAVVDGVTGMSLSDTSQFSFV